MPKSRLSATVAGLAAVMLALTVATSTASARELRAGGAPSNVDSGRSGYFVWNDGHDLQLRMASRDDSTSYRGTLHTDGKFRNLSRDGDRQDERVWISDDGHTLRFRGTPTNDVDGFKIRVEDADKVDLDLKWDGGSAPTDRIWIGRNDKHPDGSSFTLRV